MQFQQIKYELACLVSVSHYPKLTYIGHQDVKLAYRLKRFNKDWYCKLLLANGSDL